MSVKTIKIIDRMNDAKQTMKPKQELIIAKKEKQPLSKDQRTFNRLVKRLEKLRREKEETEKFLSEQLEFYGKHIHPLEEKTADLTARAIKTFYRLCNELEKLTAADKEILIDLMAAQFDTYFTFTNREPDDELKEIYKFIEGQSYDEAAEEQFSAMKEDMRQTFEEMGLEIDLDDLTFELSEEEQLRKMFEKIEGLKEQAEAKAAKKPRKKTKRQLAKEERERQIEEAKNKNISAIYKQLARVFHPDLERDAERRAEKESLMKQLTTAYKQGDLHTLLRLELEWLHKEETELENLSEEKLKIYNQALKQQVKELEIEIHTASAHPRYLPLQKYVRFFTVKSINLEFEREKLLAEIEFLESELPQLNAANPLKKVKQVIRETREAIKKRQMFALDIEEFFGKFRHD